ncbi:MAG: gamma-glutamyltransferase [Pseudomonadota bacterium]|nr:gamma-glutamyltransferase [Pseudomonadota bacterium]
MMPRLAAILSGGLISFLFYSLLFAQQNGGQAGIASAHPLATAAGFEIIEQGGNAFDAAIAVAATLAVVEPMSSGLGGGGFWLLHRASDGFQVMLDSREKAPAAATQNMYLDEQQKVIPNLSINGALAAAIPGVPAALVHMASKYGHLPLRESLKPAIRTAEQGFAVYPRYQNLLKFRKSYLNFEARKVFLTEKGDVPVVGTIIKQSDLASSLRRLAIGGRKGFYQGETAARLLESVNQAGGIWTQADLDAYQVIERTPVTGNYKGARIVSAALPSSGGILLVEMLNILSGFELDALTAVQQKQKIIEAMRLAYRDRAEFLGDADFIPVNEKLLTSMAYADEVRKNITDRATPSEFLLDSPLPEGENTTHLSVVDGDGNRVSATLSINYPFGSGLLAGGTGVVLNNEMDDFSASPGVENSFGLIGSQANAIAAGKRPLSSMTPSFIEKDDSVLVLGTPGGSRIITMVLIAVMDYLHDRGGLNDWVAEGRFHHQYHPDVVQFELGGLNKAEQNALSLLGYELREIQRKYGNMMAVLRNNINGRVQAVSDPRWQGSSEVRSEEAASIAR